MSVVPSSQISALLRLSAIHLFFLPPSCLSLSLIILINKRVDIYALPGERDITYHHINTPDRGLDKGRVTDTHPQIRLLSQLQESPLREDWPLSGCRTPANWREFSVPGKQTQSIPQFSPLVAITFSPL